MKNYVIELENRVKEEGFIKKEALTNEEWKQLWIIENPGTSKMEEIFGQKYQTIYRYITKKIGNCTSFMEDEHIYQALLTSNLTSFSTDELTKAFFSIIKTKPVLEIYKNNKGTYEQLYDVETTWEKQKRILEYNETHDTHVENFVDEFLYNLYLKIRENDFSSWLFAPYYTDPIELQKSKQEKKEFFETNDFLEKRKAYLHYEDIFEEENDYLIMEFGGGISKKQVGKKSDKNYKPNYETMNQNQKNVGDEGEEIILKELRKRFKDNENLLKKIEAVCKEDDSKGYDISYVDEQGFTNYIEVKTNATIKNDKRMSFFISKNEDEFLKNTPRSSIYYVQLHPKVRITRISREKYLELEKEPVNYFIDIECF